jgi:hypothetical protein
MKEHTRARNGVSRGNAHDVVTNVPSVYKRDKESNRAG